MCGNTFTFLQPILTSLVERKMSSNISTPVTPTMTSGKPNGRSAKLDGVKGGTGDTTRDKCIELVYDALVNDSSARKFLFPGSQLPEVIIKTSNQLSNLSYHEHEGWKNVFIMTMVVLQQLTNKKSARCLSISKTRTIQVFERMSLAVMFPWRNLPR